MKFEEGVLESIDGGSNQGDDPSDPPLNPNDPPSDGDDN